MIGGAVWIQLVALGAAVGRAWGDRGVIAGALASLMAWVIVDSAWGLVAGGAFNVLVINAPTIALLGPPLLAAWVRASR